MNLYTYRATITDVYDGDTVTADIDLGMKLWLRGEKIRLEGINAPERRGPEREAGMKSRDAVIIWLNTHCPDRGNRQVLMCTTKDKKGKYGRYIAYIYPLDQLGVASLHRENSLNVWLVDNGYAKFKEY